jgi:hypothetical protein
MGLAREYGLEVHVEEPKPKEGNTDTWTIRTVTSSASKSERQQWINIDEKGSTTRSISAPRG